ncbi:EH signature domain-containing protein [Pseudomonas aeruginosa]|uniref:EH signature domain-containing protein n=1 Tax=Pseudomonas aeruginosa TaxID=287 RepID=UPI001053046A|nr:EH signature domain-containing protein [Pseudomonas aeruginosa]
MKLPPVHMPVAEWAPVVRERWTVLVEKVARMKAASGKSDAFEAMLARLRDMASTGRFDGLPELLKRRLTARALTWLWLNDETMGRRLLSSRLLSVLVDAQQPRLTRITLQQLAQFYLRRFDKLDEHDGLRKQLEQILLQQLHLLPEPKVSGPQADPLVTLKRDAHWLLPPDGPVQLVERVRDSGHELGETFEVMGLQGFDDGRYGDICRAHFYLETLRGLAPGEYDPVLDELQKPAVSKAPYEGERRIGHVALEILIDRAGQEPGEVWQNFILNLAGDPRISRNSPNYREWWQFLGEERVQKVRGWLSKEDLRLFLQAVEQFGIETQNDDLQRMFPARKQFLEGLFKLKLIRNTRLLLGGRAQHSVKRILGKDVQTSFASMDGQMNDKAVIYLDCGDFHLVEGSHSFKIWVYLAAPGEALRSYERSSFSHSDLTTAVPKAYKRLYPELPYDAFTHHPPLSWQNRVFSFLADNGIALDIEQLLNRSDYQPYLRKFGMPVVNAKRTPVPPPSQTDFPAEPARSRVGKTGATTMSAPQGRKPAEMIARDSRAIPREEAATVRRSNQQHDPVVSHSVSSPDAAAPATARPSLVGEGLLTGLKPSALKILRYFVDNPGDKVRYAANVFGVDSREINQILYGPLKDMCTRDEQFGWTVNEAARLALEALDEQDRAE